MEKETIQENVPAPGNIVARYFKQMPIFFPLIGLFLLGMMLFEAFYYIGDDSIGHIYWLRPLVLLFYFLGWAGICLRSKIAGMGFVLLTIANVAFYLFGPDILAKRALGDILFIPIPVNLLFSFLLLFYFRRLR